MALAGLVMLALLPAPRPVGSIDLPPDVTSFAIRRARCDHFRGEDADGAARRAEIARGLAANCRGTDAELARLLRRHARDTAVRDHLSEYDLNVEVPSSR